MPFEEEPVEQAPSSKGLRAVTKPWGVFRACYATSKSYITLRKTGEDKPL